MKASRPPLLLGALLLSLSKVGVSNPTRRNGSHCGLPLVQDQALQDSIKVENLVAHAKALEAIAYSTPGRNRLTGTDGFNLTTEYIKAQLDRLNGYYTVEVQPWEGVTQASANSTFSVNGQVIASLPIEYSRNGTLTGVPLVPVANLGCNASDFTSAVAGNIALIFRGSCTFLTKATLARDAGAVAVVFYNNPANTGIVSGTYGEDVKAPLPGSGISQADGEALVAAYNSGTVLTAYLDVFTTLAPLYSQNIIATSKYGDPNNVLFLGAHADSVEDGPGINDDGSGTIGILETAIQLAKWRTKAKVKFGWWTAEEFGMKGSSYYVSTLSDEQLLKIRLYLNFDMIASPNYVLGHYDGDGSEYGVTGPPGSAEAEHFFEEYYESLGLNHTATEFNRRSDYRDFFDAGVPCGGLDAGADEVKTQEWADMFGGTPGIILDPNYHSANDNFANLNLTAFEIMSKGIGHAVAFYGKTAFAGFPAREPPEKRSVATRPIKIRGASTPRTYSRRHRTM